MMVTNKEKLREHYLAVRKQLSLSRIEEAKSQIDLLCQRFLLKNKMVLSYSPLSDEVDVSAFNERLAKKELLALPRVEDNRIRAYSVKNIGTGLLRSKYGCLEPIPEKSSLVKNFSVALVPGLVFDLEGKRIGFGFGHYDRFLKGNTPLHTIGVAFKEQIHSEKFILESHDIPMDEMFIV